MSSYICVRLKELRLEKKITQKELAKILNVPVSKISEWEQLINFPNIVQIAQLSHFFDVTIQYIQSTSNIRKFPTDMPYSQIKKYISKHKKIKCIKLHFILLFLNFVLQYH